MVLLFTFVSYDKKVEFFAIFSRNMSYAFKSRIDIILEKYLWRGKMKNFKKLLILAACFGLFVNFGNCGQLETSNGISTCAILEEDVFAD